VWGRSWQGEVGGRRRRGRLRRECLHIPEQQWRPAARDASPGAERRAKRRECRQPCTPSYPPHLIFLFFSFLYVCQILFVKMFVPDFFRKLCLKIFKIFKDFSTTFFAIAGLTFFIFISLRLFI
jgi:hypothetical protein